MTSSSFATCWTVITGAAAGRREDRSAFARRYERMVRAYFAARWRGSFLAGDIDDAVQEVFLDCFREGGVLERAERERPGGFRAFLYGVVRNVALRIERKNARRRDVPAAVDPEDAGHDSFTPSRAFDRAWATAILKEAGGVMADQATDDDAKSRLKLLQMRFQDGMPIREIAQQWGEEPRVLHRAYARARDEFRAALVGVVTFHHGGTPGEVERECARLLDFF